MSQNVQILRSLVEQRLTAAAEEIFGLFERTIAEYEEELCRTKEENQRQRQILDTVLLHTSVVSADTHQQSVGKEDFPPEQKEWSPSVDQNQEDSENHHIKEEQEELWTNQEADITKFPSTSVPLNNEDKGKAQSSQLHQRQTEKNQEETETGEDCEGSEPASSLDPYKHLQPVSDDSSSDSSETEDSDCDWTETYRTQSGSGSVKTRKLVKTDNGLSSMERPFLCSYCGKRFTLKGNLKRHMGNHTEERPFSCSDCDKSFKNRQSLTTHMRCHTGEQPYSCSECGRSFNRNGNFHRHMKVHTGVKPFSCSVCTKSFTVKDQLNRHMKYHTGEKPFSCNICGKCCTTKGDLSRHMRVHTGQRPFSCSVCGKSFTENEHLKKHMKLHTTD